jgi:hypothetical protein
MRSGKTDGRQMEREGKIVKDRWNGVVGNRREKTHQKEAEDGNGKD